MPEVKIGDIIFIRVKVDKIIQDKEGVVYRCSATERGYGRKTYTDIDILPKEIVE